MKKSIAILAAFLMICTVSCSGKKPENVISEPVPEAAPEIAEVTEPAFREFFPEDFTEIKVNLDYQDGEAPIPRYKRKMTISLEKELSPCKDGYVIDEEIELPDYYDELDISDEDRQELINNYIEYYKNDIEDQKARLDKPYAKLIHWMIYGGGYVFAQIEYDDMSHRGSHAFDIVRIDPETSETTVVYSHRDKDETMEVSWMVYAGGSLYFATTTIEGMDDYGLKTDGLYRVNEGAGTLDKIDISFLTENFTTWGVDYGTEDRLIVSGFKNIDGVSGRFILVEYDPTADEWHTLSEADNIDYSSYPLIYGDSFIMQYEDENSELCLSSEGNFTLHTGLRGAYMETVQENMISVVVDDALDNVYLYVYDLEKRERYDYDLTGKGIYPDTMAAINGNALYMAKTNGYVILLPAIGAAFREDVPDTCYTIGGKQVIINTSYLTEEENELLTERNIVLTIIG